MRIGLVEIDSWRELAGLHGDERSRESGGAARTLGVPDLRFQSGHRDLARLLFSQCQLESLRLHAIIHFGRGAVQVYVLNIFWRNLGLFEREGDGARGLFGGITYTYAMERFTCLCVFGDVGA